MTAPQRFVQNDDRPAASTTSVVVFGAGRQSTALAESLAGSIDSVTLVGPDADPDRTAEDVDVVSRATTNAAEVQAIAATVGSVDAVVATGSDSEALLAGYLARMELDPSVVIATVSDPTRGAAFQDTGIERIDVPEVLAEHVRERLEDASV